MLIKELSKPEGKQISEGHAEALILVAAALGCRIENATSYGVNVPNVYNLLPPTQTIGIHAGKFYQL